MGYKVFNSLKSHRGFTLTEMLTVVLIVGVMVSLALPQYRRIIQRSRASEAIAMLRVLSDSATRLATSFGSRTVAGFAGGHADKFVFERLDMVGSTTLPMCSYSGTTMTCDNFTYTLNSDGTISALQTSPATGVTLTVHPDVGTPSAGFITCAETGGGNFCDLYGYGADETEE